MAQRYFCDGICKPEYKSQLDSDPWRHLFKEPVLQAEDHSSGRDETRFVSHLTFPHLFPRLLSLEYECVNTAGHTEPRAAARLAKTYLQAWQLPSAAKQSGEQLSFP